MLETLILGGLAAASTAVGTAVERLRPAGRARGRAARAVHRVDRELRRLDRLVEKREAALVEAAGAWESVAADARLAGLQLETLRDYGAEKVRWGALEDAGLHTVADLTQITQARLEALEGIGPVTADRILAARNLLVEAERGEPAAPPRPDEQRPEARAVVRAAHDLLAVREPIEPERVGLRTWVAGLRDRLSTVRHKAAWYRGWNQERTRLRAESIEQADGIATEVAEERVPSGRLGHAEAARAAAREALRQAPDADALAQEHETRMAAFSAVIDRALSGGDERDEDALRGGLPIEIARRVEAAELRTDGLHATLRGYQEFGARYLLVQRRTLLGDEMGLGKTVQALAAMVHVAHAEGGRRFLVVAPASVLMNWQRETLKHTTLPAVVLHGEDREEQLEDWSLRGGVAVTSFGTLSRLPLFEGALEALRIDLLVVDEAHYAKNPEAARTQHIVAVAQRSDRVVFMSGTPLENRIEEFRELIRPLQPELAARLDGDAPAADGFVVGHRAFRVAVAPAYLRRNQSDVLRELPDRIEKEEWVRLNPTEVAAYREAVAARNIMGMRRAATIGYGGLESSKLERLEELVAEYRAEGRKVLVFSFFLDVLEAVAERMETVGTINGSVPPADRQQLCDDLAAREGHAMLLGQIDAAGTGLNLQAASVVVLLEPQWKPSTEEQAVARAHRMGQTRAVIVHRFFAGDSVDERMKEVLAGKRELFDRFARESAVSEASPEATETELVRLVVDSEVERLGVDAEPAAPDPV